MHTVHFATQNRRKVDLLRQMLGNDVDILHENLPLPGLGEGSVEADAIQKARAAFTTLQKPVVTHSVSLVIASLSGWPGIVLNREINQNGAKGIITKVCGKGRECELRFALAYLDAQLGESQVFSATSRGSIAYGLGENLVGDQASPLGFLFIPEGSHQVLNEFSKADFDSWRRAVHGEYCEQFAAWLKVHRPR